MTHIKLVVISFLLILIHSSSEASILPSLKKDCRFYEFQTNRMPNEREKLWQRSNDEACHDLKGERAYDQSLTAQVVDCYRSLKKSILESCNFEELEFDNRTVQIFAASSESYYWQVLTKQGENIIYPEKISYFKKLGKKITSCFTLNNLKGISRKTFEDLYATIKVLEKYKIFPIRTAHVIRKGWGRDSESTDYISINGITLMDDHEGNISIRY